MSKKRCLALDTETTGFGHAAALLSFYAVEFDPVTGETGEDLNLNFNPGFSIPWKITEITGISNEMASKWPRLEISHAKKITDFLAGADVWIHNQTFDEGVLNRNFEMFRVKPLAQIANLNCSMKKAKQMGHPKVSLNALCEHYGIDLSGRQFHGAKVDTHLLLQLVVKLNSGN